MTSTLSRMVQLICSGEYSSRSFSSMQASTFGVILQRREVFTALLRLHLELNGSVSPGALRIENFWEVTGQGKTLALTIDAETPENGKALETMAHQLGCGEMFPRLSREDMDQIAGDGKIPVYKKWAKRVEKREIAIDTLMNLAGLASFTADQRALDERILKLIS